MCRKSTFPTKTMPAVRLMLPTIILALACCASALAQESAQVSSPSALPTVDTAIVTGAATAERLRFAAPNAVVQMRLEVYNQAGQKVLDTEQRGGNVLDWHLQTSTGERVADGSYLCVVTVKNLSGRFSQKIGTATVNAQAATLRSATVSELNARQAQAQAVGPIEREDEGLVVKSVEDPQPVTVLAHTGDEAQLSRTRGALGFRVGDFFSGMDKEQMRLTEAGNLGIGTSKPKAKLDVAGMIRAREGFQFSDGSNLNVNDKGALTLTSRNGNIVPNATGTGTQDKIAKWTGNADTLGDSAITETAGNVGIGTPTPTQALEVANGRILAIGTKTLTGPGGIIDIGTTVTNNGNQASGLRMRNTFNGNATTQQGLDVAPTFAPSASISLARGFIAAGFFAPPAGVTITDAYGGDATTVYSNTSGAVTNGTAFAINSPVALGILKPTTQYGLHINNQGIAGTTNSYGLFVDAQAGSANNFSAIFEGGNVGIGTNNPATKLDVVGNINTSTQYRIGGNIVLQTPGTQNTFAGVLAGANGGGANGSFFGFKAGTANTTGNNNSFFGTFAGAANQDGANNSFFGEGAGAANITGDSNAFFGFHAGVSDIASTNSFFGFDAGALNTTAAGNSYFGFEAGKNGTTATGNSFFGFQAGTNAISGFNSFFGTSAGSANTNGNDNSFFGFNAGAANTSGDFNAFFGGFAGVTNNTGIRNSFFGDFAGHDNTSGQDNSFFGLKAGEHNNTGVSNTFAGIDAGDGNTNGGSNAFFGNHAGENNSTGDKNTVLGADADLSSGNLTNATAIGAQAFVTQSNSMVLGSIQNVNGAPADTKVGIGTSAPDRHLHVFGAGDQEIAIESSDAGGRQWTLQSSRGASPFSGEFQIIDRTANASRLSILSTGNVGIGTTAPGNRLHVVANLDDFDGIPTPGEHVALIENTYAFGGQDVLALKIDAPGDPNVAANYITFFNANNASIGAIEGNNGGGIQVVGPGNDYAEWLPRLNPAEKTQPGEIVGLYNGHITKNTRGAAQVMAVSTGSIVAGNDPGKAARAGFEQVAFIGQVMARVRGTVQAGDFIVASGLNDGTGIAVSPALITAEQFEQVAGEAWETSADAGVKSVRVAVGLLRHDPTVRHLLEFNRSQADRIGTLNARLTALEAQLTSTHSRTSSLRVARKKRPLVARVAAGTSGLLR